MNRYAAPFLHKLAAFGLAVSTAILSYAGFLHMFEQPLLAALVGASAGGFVLGRGWRARRV